MERPQLRMEGMASTHQADCRFGTHAGSQCLSNCVVYLTSCYYNREVPLLDTPSLDDVLERGSKLDFILRQSGLLGFQQYAQLHHIPSYLRTDDWTTKIFQSAEFFGLLDQEATIREPFIETLRSVLSRNYAGTVQYFILICQAKSAAIIIKDKTFFMFDPHCVPHIPNSPAHVLKTDDVQTLLSYIGPADTEYTGCFLYFLPHDYVSPEHYITNHYRTITFEELHGPQVDISTGVEAASITELDSPPDSPGVSDSSSSSSVPRPEVIPQRRPRVIIPPYPPSGRPRPPRRNRPPSTPTTVRGADGTQGDARQPHSVILQETDKQTRNKDDDVARHDPSSPRDEEQNGHRIPSPSGTLESKESESGSRNPEEGETQTPHMETESREAFDTPLQAPGAEELLADLAAARGQKRKFSAVVDVQESDETEQERLEAAHPLETEDIWIDDPPEQLYPKTDTPSFDPDPDNSEEFADDPDVEVNPDRSLASFNFSNATAEALASAVSSPSLTRIDTLLDAFPKVDGEKALPTIVDLTNARSFRESQALRDLDRLMTLVVLENGLISDRANKGPSKCVHALQFFLLWGDKMGIPISDAKRVLDAGLAIPEVCDMVQQNQIRSSRFARHLTNKLNRVLSTLYSHSMASFRTVIQNINAEGVKISSREEQTSIANLGRTIAARLGTDFYAVCSREDMQTIVEYTRRLQTAIQKRNTQIRQEEVRFQSVLEALDASQPPPAWEESFEILPDRKLKVFVEHLTMAEAKITTKLIEVLQNYLDGSSDRENVLTNVPKVSHIMIELDNLLKNVDYVSRKVLTNNEVLTPFRQQLLYLGGELSSLLGLDWAHPSAEPIQPLNILKNIRGKMAHAEARLQNQSAIDQILSDAEALLQNISDPASPQFRSQSVSIPVLENYVKNAGVLLGQEHSERYDRLKTAIEALISSETFVTMTLHDIGLPNLVTNVGKLREVFASSPHLPSSPAVKEALTTACAKVIREALESLERRDAVALPQGAALAMEMLLSYGSFQDYKELVRLIADVAAVQKAVREGGEDKWTTAESQLERLKSTLAATAIETATKRRLYRLIQGDMKEAQKNHARQLMENWKREVLAFSPASREAAQDFLKQAPTDKAREFAQRHFKRQHGLQLDLKPDDTVVAMEYSTTPLPKPKEIDRVAAERGDEAWKRIQRAFRDFTFNTISPQDWEALAADYQRPGSALPNTVGTVLMGLLEGILKTLDELYDQRLRSLLQDPTPYQPPAFDWLSPYREHVSFFLRTIGLPLVRTLAEKIETRAQQIIHALRSTDLQQATAGTPLEGPVREYEQLLSELTSTHNDHGLQARSDVADYTEAQRTSANVTVPPRPVLVVPKTYIPTTRLSSVDALPGFLRSFLLSQEAKLLAMQKADFEDLERDMKTAEAHRKASREENQRKMSHALAQLLPQAPVAISGRPFNPQEPTGFLENIVHENVLDRETYGVAKQGLGWLEYAIKSLTVYAPIEAKQRLYVLTEEARKRRLTAEACETLEDAANRGDDTETLERALAQLPPHRVKGGKATIDGWRMKLQALRAMIDDAERVSLLLATVDLTAGRAQATLSPTELTELFQKGQETLGGFKTGETTSELKAVRERLSELQMYIKYKKQFLEIYETTQPAVFSAFPLAREIVACLEPHVGPFDNTSRLRAYARLNQSQSPPVRWLLTTPTFDPDTPAAVPIGGHDAPLHRQVIFFNFLEALLPTAAAVTVTVPAHGFPGTELARRSLEASWGFLNQWEDISRLLPEVLETFADSAPPPADKGANKFLAMCVLTYLIHAASPIVQVPPVEEIQVDTFPEEVVLQPRDMVYLLLAMWPGWASGMLKKASYTQSLRECAMTLALMLRAVPYLTLTPPGASMQPLPVHLHVFGFPEAFPFFPDEWKPVDVRKSLWLRRDFLAICHRSPGRARIACLVWALTHLEPAVVEQLWGSLRPLNATEADSTATLLSWLIDAEFGPYGPEPKLETATEVPSYPYGRPTGTRLTLHTLERRPRSESPSVSGFEVALASILFHTRLRIYATASTHRISKTRGGFLLLSPILDCLPDREPFASLAAAPRKVKTPIYAERAIHTTEELQVFARQAAWLQRSFVAPDRSSRDTSAVLTVILNADNTVAASYTTHGVRVMDSRPFYIMPGKPTGRWPEVLALKSHPVDARASANEAISIFMRLTEDQRQANSSDIFSQVPTYLNMSTEAPDVPHVVTWTRPPVSAPTTDTILEPQREGFERSSQQALRNSVSQSSTTSQRPRRHVSDVGLTPRSTVTALARTEPATTPKTAPGVTEPRAKTAIVVELQKAPTVNPPPIKSTKSPVTQSKVSEPKGLLETRQSRIRIATPSGDPPQARATVAPPQTPTAHPSKSSTPHPVSVAAVSLQYRPPALRSTKQANIVQHEQGGPQIIERPSSLLPSGIPESVPVSWKSPNIKLDLAPTASPVAPTRVGLTQGRLETQTPSSPLQSHPPRITIRPQINTPPSLPQEVWDTAVDIPLPHSSPESTPPDSPASQDWSENTSYPEWPRGLLHEPSLEIVRLKHGEIAANPTVLTEPSIRRLTTERPWTPLVPPSMQDTETETAKLVLINFIKQIRQRVAAMAALLAQGVARIKAWYF
ncbi:large tegument protein [Colobine gammaherpesvirus 1]|uniref:Large tegument protein n=1 Tax=Colobine gammaherpesvirus 1 TaxID=2597325 RepID=A0A5B8G7G0_9GAMA|nr:large tegument protein [Colobine gammaherpesvirus 1]QDQ69275.1 large tegument protein [Colobine gammaherpesvirus 1]